MLKGIKLNIHIILLKALLAENKISNNEIKTVLMLIHKNSLKLSNNENS